MIARLKLYRNTLTILLLSIALPPAASNIATDPAAARERAGELAAAGELRQAHAIYADLVEAYPENIEDQLALGRIQLERGQAYAATRPLEAAKAIDSDREGIYRLLRNAYLASGQSERAYGILQEARTRFGEQPWMKGEAQP